MSFEALSTKLGDPSALGISTVHNPTSTPYDCPNMYHISRIQTSKWQAKLSLELHCFCQEGGDNPVTTQVSLYLLK